MLIHFLFAGTPTMINSRVEAIAATYEVYFTPENLTIVWPEIPQGITDLSITFAHSFTTIQRQAILSNIVKHNPGVSILNLRFEEEERIGSFIHVLDINQTVAKLCLNSGVLGDNEGDKGVQALACILRVNRALEECEIIGTDMSDEGVEILGAALRENPHTALTALSLAHNNRIKKVSALVELKLERLSLEGTSVWLGDVVELIEKNTALAELNLSGTEIEDKDIKAFLLRIAATQHLRKPDLSYNNISDESISTIKEALTLNPSLTLILWESDMSIFSKELLKDEFPARVILGKNIQSEPIDRIVLD